MNILFSKNILDRAEILKNELETMTQFILRAVEYYVLKLEEEKKNDRGKKD